MREVLNGLRWIIRAGAAWRMMLNDLPPLASVYQETQRWLRAGIFEAMVHDLWAILRLADRRRDQPSAVILDRRILQSTPESGSRAGYDRANRKRGNKIHIAVDILGRLLLLHVMPANEQDRAQVEHLAAQIQEVAGDTIEVVFVDQGNTDEHPAQAAQAHGIQLKVVRLPGAKKGCVLLPRRWVVERSFAWAARFRRLAQDYERLPEMMAGLHFLAFTILILRHV